MAQVAARQVSGELGRFRADIGQFASQGEPCAILSIRDFAGRELGDPDTTAKVTVKHLICACTGMPRQDLEWLLEYHALTRAGGHEPMESCTTSCQ